MTREEVAEIINYCQTNQVTYKARLQELGIPTWKFYDAHLRRDGYQGASVNHPSIVWPCSVLTTSKDRYISEYTFREKESHDLLDETIIIIFAELTKSQHSQKINTPNTKRICSTKNA